jgi:hypothetical protein
MHMSVQIRLLILALATLTFMALVACSDEPEPITIIKEVPIEKR